MGFLFGDYIPDKPTPMYHAQDMDETLYARLVDAAAGAIDETESFGSEHRAILTVYRLLALLAEHPEQIPSTLLTARQFAEALPECLLASLECLDAGACLSR